MVAEGTVAEAVVVQESKPDVVSGETLDQIRASVTQDVVKSIIDVLSEKFLGVSPVAAELKTAEPAAKAPAASERIAAIKAFDLPRENSENAVLTVTLGGGTRKPVTIGGARAMPFHHWEGGAGTSGAQPNRPLVALEVFDQIGAKYPPVLKEEYGKIIDDPAAHAKMCVEEHGADLISVRLDATHPERGNRTAVESVELVGKILKAVDVPLIITGHNHFDKNNEVMKAIAQAYEGENLLFNWVEQDNYKTVAGAAMAYGHCVAAQSPIDVNIGKQLNILLTNMGLAADRIIMDPMTGAVGYGIEYTYSVMERIRQTGLGGDKMLCAPMIVSPGQECAKIKEYKADAAQFPAWGELAPRAAMWELSTAVSLLHAGADVLIMYHPKAAMALRKTIDQLMAN
ncbi:MAG: acetyl-CoA decarbonylase/synthase complex subunit delta [Clostridia bacterium]|nr:acetyl-CoA decarbonylase/synthase complex subunit delta [Clostridia bacterium]